MPASPSCLLLPPAPLERLLVGMDSLNTQEYRAVRILARGMQRRLEQRVGQPSAVSSLAEKLLTLCRTQVVSTATALLAINLCRERLRWENRLRGPDTRVTRKVLFEELQLLKRRVQAGLKIKEPFPVRRTRHGATQPAELRAYIDASIRPSVTGIGVLVQNAKDDVVAEISVPGEGSASDEVEAHAAVTALRTARALGASSVMLCTDSNAILDVLGTPPRIQKPSGFQLRDRLLSEIRSFDYVEVVKVPRAYNHYSDRLAAKVLSK